MATSGTGGEVKNDAHFELEFVGFQPGKPTSPPVPLQGAYCLLVFFEERKQTLSPQIGTAFGAQRPPVGCSQAFRHAPWSPSHLCSRLRLYSPRHRVEPRPRT